MPKVVVPEYLLCPISLQLMKNPVMTADGQVYDHDEIQKWLATNNTSPLTNKALSHKNLIPATIIKNVIEDFNKNLCSKETFTSLISEKKIKELMECRYLDSYLKDCNVLADVINTRNVDIVEWILNEGADIDGITDRLSKETLLFNAVQVADLHLCKFLISRGASVDVLNSEGQNLAITAPNLEILQLVVNAGCKLDIVVDGFPLLFWKVDQLEQLQWLHTQMGMDIKVLGPQNITLLHEAAKCGTVDCLKYLLGCGLSVFALNAHLETPLHFAANRDDPAVVEFFLQNGAYVDSKDKSGNTPLMSTIQNFQPTCAQILLDHGADMFAANSGNETPYSYGDSEDQSMFIEHHRKLLAERQQYKAQEAQRQQESQRQQMSDVQQTLEFMKKTLLQVKDGIEEMKESTPKKRKKS